MLKTVGRYIHNCAGPIGTIYTRADLFKSIQEKYKNNGCRYAVRDKSETYSVFSHIRRDLLENQYVVRRANIEKKKCFENIENVQKHWYKIKRINNQVPQTTYDLPNPTLWKKIRNMYHINRIVL